MLSMTTVRQCHHVGDDSNMLLAVAVLQVL